MIKDQRHESVLTLYASSTLRRKEIALQAGVSHDNMRKIVQRARTRGDTRSLARDNPLTMLPKVVRRRLKKEAARESTTEHGLAAALLEIVATDYRLLLQVKARAHLPRQRG